MTIKIDKCNEDIFEYNYLENIVDNNAIVFLYVYNKELKSNLNYVLNKNIEFVKKEYNTNIDLFIDVNINLHQTLNNIFKKNIILPSIIVFKNKQIVEFLEDLVLIEK